MAMAMAMPPIFKLPDELIVQITTYLPQVDLYQLSLVSKRVGLIAQKTLHHTPDIWLRPSPAGGYIRFLVRTLSSRPDLAATVRTLAVFAFNREVEVDVDVLPAVQANITPLMPGLKFTINEQKLVGILLILTTHLRHLALGVSDKHEMIDSHPLRPSYNVPGGLFGYHTSDWATTPFDLSQIPGLKGLQSLRIDVGQLDWSWFALPSLKNLYVSQPHSLRDYTALPASSNLRKIELRTDLRALEHRDSAFNRHFPSFLSHVDKLKEVALTAKDFGGVRTATGMSWATLISRFEPSYSKLEHLKLRFGDPGLLPNALPVSTLGMFVRLRYLYLPQDVLLGKPSEVIASTKCPNTLLPSSLERLTIIYPTLDIIHWLRKLKDCYDHFTGLLRILILASEIYGDGYEQFRYKKLPNHGLNWAKFRVRITYPGGEKREVWKDPNYDPFICEIVDFINSLSIEA
ncbi:hypothetical protein BDV96DRAFT_647677 [Lophiotrema nucula]|uniref:F-box domain-containing protein n=1 Tax=Lophiotrema nucula TaxID=690887 RepID=A0A6A5Z759_9PLEO|nr:hypothetical protein BDV96DRAFT_647677 [Lophiotrema nucula]